VEKNKPINKRSKLVGFYCLRKGEKGELAGWEKETGVETLNFGGLLESI